MSFRYVLAGWLMFAGALSTAEGRADDIQYAPLALFVNETENDTVTVMIRDADILVLREDLEKAGLRRVPRVADETVQGKTYVSLARLGPVLHFAFDESALTLRITAPAQYFATTSIDLHSTAPPGTVQYKDVGIFLNYAPRLINLRTPAASGEAGLSLDGHLLFSSVTVTPTQGVVRGLTNLTVDEPASLRRWVFGDSTVSSGGALSGSQIQAGLSVGRAFQLDPYYVAAPTLTTTGAVLTASTLNVYVNGILVRQQSIQPGAFQIQNLPATTGAGTTRYVLLDAFGRQTQVASNFYAAAGTLAKGVSDYNFSVGAARTNYGSTSWQYGGLVMSGYYRVGASNSLTTGFRGESWLGIGDTRPSGGPFLTVLTHAGQFDFAVAGSATHDGNGAAASAAYGYGSRPFSVGVTIRGMSDRYSNISVNPSDNRDTCDGTGSLSVPIGRRATFTPSYALGISRDSGLTSRVGIQSNLILTRDISVAFTGGRSINADGSAPFDGFVTVNVQLGRVTVSASETVAAKDWETSLSLMDPVPVGNGFGFQASGTQGEHTQFVGTAQGQSQYGQVQISANALDKAVTSEVDVGGAIVFMPKAGFFLTRPVQDGFAVIQVTGASNVRGYLNNNEVGRTNSSGNLIIPNLLSYYANRLSISDEDVPLDYRIEGGEHLVATPYRGGAVVRFDAHKTSFVRGVVSVRRGGKDAIPSYGEMTVQVGGKPVVSPIAREGEFEFEALSAGRYAAVVEYAEGDCTLSILVAEPKGPVADLGHVICEAP